MTTATWELDTIAPLLMMIQVITGAVMLTITPVSAELTAC